MVLDEDETVQASPTSVSVQTIQDPVIKAQKIRGAVKPVSLNLSLALYLTSDILLIFYYSFTFLSLQRSALRYVYSSIILFLISPSALNFYAYRSLLLPRRKPN